MSQNRDAPAYQEYAANILSKKEFRFMSKSERGILYTMKLECWCNKTLPANIEDLSKYLGLDVTQQEFDVVMQFFRLDGDSITNPELDAYRAHLDEIKRKKSEGGKKGMASRYENSNSQKNDENTTREGANSPITKLQVSNNCLVQSNTVQHNQEQFSKKGSSQDCDFIEAYNSYEAEQCTAEDYQKESGGF